MNNNSIYDDEGFITHSTMPIKFKWNGGSKRPYADTVVGVLLKGVKNEEEAKNAVRNFGSGETIYDNRDERKGWWEYYFSKVEKVGEDLYQVNYVKPFTD